MQLEIEITNKDEKGLPFFGKRTLIEIFDEKGARATSHTLKAGEAKTVTIEPNQRIGIRVKGT